MCHRRLKRGYSNGKGKRPRVYTSAEHSDFGRGRVDHPLCMSDGIFAKRPLGGCHEKLSFHILIHSHGNLKFLVNVFMWWDEHGY